MDKVLIISGNSSIIASFIATHISELEKRGVAVETVSAPRKGVDKVNREKPSAVIYDFESFPAEWFKNFKDSVHALDEPLPIIGCGRKDIENHGADFYLKAPFTSDELAAVLRAKTTVRI